MALLIETSLASGRDVLRGVARYVREHEPWALYHEPHGLEESAPGWLKRWKGDGIIARVQTRAVAQMLLACRVPVVDVLGVVPDLPFPLVFVDNAAIGRMGAEHLLERGFRNFGYFGIAGENWSAQRYEAFCTALGSGPESVSLYELARDRAGKHSWEKTEDSVARWVAALPKPAGLMVCSDQRGPLLLEACRRAGVRVPDEVAVIGVDNDETLCEVCSPPLSSIEVGHWNVGHRAAELLEALMRGQAAPKKSMLVEPLHPIARLSTDVHMVADPAVAHALRLIREQAHTGLRVEAIAQEVGLSRSVLQRRFRAVMKQSAHQELLEARIKKARELLTGTDLPLAVVAERAGFRHQEYMGAVFKERVGCTPGSLRQRAVAPRGSAPHNDFR